jgi:hypothetical protein
MFRGLDRFFIPIRRDGDQRYSKKNTGKKSHRSHHSILLFDFGKIEEKL